MIFTKSYWGSGSNTLSEIRRALAGILSAYSSILFVDHPLIGILFLGATFWFPNVGIAGLIGAAIGMTVGYVLRLPYSTSGVNVYSSLLCWALVRRLLRTGRGPAYVNRAELRNDGIARCRPP